MRNVTAIGIIVLALFSACMNWGNLDSDQVLEKKIREIVISGNERLSFVEVVEFEWDSLIILTPYTSPEHIEQELKIDLRPIYHFGIDYRDDICLILFFENGKLINMVEYPRYPGDFANNKNNFVKKEEAEYKIKTTNQKSTTGKDWIVVELNKKATPHNKS